MGALSPSARRFLAAVVVAVLLAVGFTACTRRGTSTAPSSAQMADQIGAQVMTDVERGYVPGRSGDVLLIPKPHSFVLTSADQCGVVGGPPAVATTHAEPWNYLARVPLAFYGPGLIPAGKTVDDPVTLASVAPTYAGLMGLKGFTADAPPLAAVVDGAKHRPKLIVTVLIDGGGWNVLQNHAAAWPVLHGMFDQGTLYENATNGSSPSITGAIMATVGTGDYPRTHGIPGNQMRGPNGEPVDTWNDDGDPSFLRVPTVGDDYDRSTGNRSVQALIGAEGWHLGLLGKGSAAPGGDKDLAAWFDRDTQKWVTNPQYYTMPPWLGGLDTKRLAAYDLALDGADGITDGRWFGQTPQAMAAVDMRSATPSFARLEFDAAIRVIDGARLGTHGVTDMLAIEAESPDQAGHVWGSTSPQEESVLSTVDTELGRLVDVLNRKVGEGNYVVALTADHGQETLPETTGGVRINGPELKNDLVAEFGPVVTRVAASEIYLNHAEMAKRHVTAEDVAGFLAAYTVRDATPDRRLPYVAPARLDQTVFAGVFPGSFIDGLTQQEIQSFGQSSYPEGVLPTAQPPPSG